MSETRERETQPPSAIEVHTRQQGEPPPAWLTEVLGEMRRDRTELLDFARGLESRLNQLDRIEANQNLMGQAVEEMRSEMRARIGAHDGELERGAKMFADHERRITALEAAERARKDAGG